MIEKMDDKQTVARKRNLLRFVYAQDSRGIYDGTGTEEANAYIEHPILRERLVEISEAVLNSETSVRGIRTGAWMANRSRFSNRTSAGIGRLWCNNNSNKSFII